MEFHHNYYSPMDRGYHQKPDVEYEISIPNEPMPHLDTESDTEAPAGYGVKDIGMSVPLGISAANVPGIQAKIRSGTQAIEIQFPGAVRGSRNAQTPEQYGTDQRRAIDEIRRANDIRFTTHASFGVMGLSGADGHGNFSWSHQKMAVDEVKKAIEFAADAAGGGSVVVHTGEYERPISEMPWSRDQNWRLMFRKYYTEPDDAQFPVIDDRTGQVISTVQKDRLVARPVWLRADHDYDGVDQKGHRTRINKDDYIDYEGRRIIDTYDPVNGRLPKYNEDKGRFDVEMWHFNDFIKEAEETNRLEERKRGRNLRDEEMVYPEEVYIRATLETQEGHARGWALQYARGFESYRKAVDKLEELKKKYIELKKHMKEEDLWKIAQQDYELPRVSQMIQPGTIDPIELIDRELKEAR